MIKKIGHVFLGQHGLWAFIFLIFVAQLLGQTIDSLAVRLAVSLFFSLFLLVGILSLSRSSTRMAVGLVAFAAFVLRWLGHVAPTPVILSLGLTTALLVMIFLTLVNVGKVFRDDQPVTAARVTGAVGVYILFGLTWAYLYSLVNLLLPGAFVLPEFTDLADPDHQESFTYFSFITLTTLGYGDITPVHPVARMCVVIQALFGQLYPATLLARLVSLEIASRAPVRPPDRGEP